MFIWCDEKTTDLNAVNTALSTQHRLRGNFSDREAAYRKRVNTPVANRTLADNVIARHGDRSFRYRLDKIVGQSKTDLPEIVHVGPTSIQRGLASMRDPRCLFAYV